MKRILLPVSLFMAGAALNAQVQRTCMAEGFSNASCPPCAAQNPGYNTLLGSNTTKVIAVKYQTNWPGFDPMNVQTQTEVGPRVTYYGVSGVPYGRLDGTAFAGPNYVGALANLDQAEIDARYAMTSPFSLVVTSSTSADNDSIYVSVEATTPAAFSSTDLKLHVLLTENEIDFPSAPGSNGETQFHHVMRKMIAGSAGYTLPASWAAAENHTYTFAIPVPTFIYKYSEMKVIAFIQTNSTKEIFQAAEGSVVVNNYGKTQNITGITPLNCTPSMTGLTVNFVNDGSNTITSATISYQVDGGTPQTIPYSGSLAAGASTTINIPTVSGLTDGAHTLTTWASNINGSGLTTPMGTTNKGFTISTDAATAAPLVQNFSNTSFPYAGWVLDNPNPDVTWTRVAAGSGSVKFNNFAYANGTNSGMIVEPTEYSALTTPTLTFDVAYRQYSSENDRLEVLISTDCGASWTSVYNKAGSTLSTLGASTTAFTPSAASDWRKETISLSAYAGASSVFIKFKATSNYGNNLYVDNINIDNASMGIEDNASNTFNVYPNPTSDIINISLVNAENVTVSLINTLGETVKVFNNVNDKAILSLEGLANGVYILNADIDGHRVSQRIIKK